MRHPARRSNRDSHIAVLCLPRRSLQSTICAPLCRQRFEEHSNLLVVAANHHDGVSADARSEVVTGLRNLAFVSDIDPTALEDASELGIEDRSIDVDRAVARRWAGHRRGSRTGSRQFSRFWYTRNTKNSKHLGWTGNTVPACIGRSFLEVGGYMAGQKKSDSLRGQVYQQLLSALRKGKLGFEPGGDRTRSGRGARCLAHSGARGVGAVGARWIDRLDEPGLHAPGNVAGRPRGIFTKSGACSSRQRWPQPSTASAHTTSGSLRQFLGEQEAADNPTRCAAFVEANSNFRAVWLGAVPTSSS